ncbi:MAG: trypsin-like peptidase domain-containing protein [Bdellovibrionota bacterium]
MIKNLTTFFFYLSLASLAMGLKENSAQAIVLQSFSDIAEKAIPGVVNIRTKTYIRRESTLDLYQFFLQGKVPTGRTTSSLGSGVILDRSGYIITNHHVIKGANTIEVLFAKSKKKIAANIIGIDPKTDLALLKVNTNQELHPMSLGDSDKLKIGDLVLAIGNPFGFSHTVTSGIISAKSRVIGTGPYDNFLQTDASIHPGNSGGPLIDVRGRVIGINTAISSEGEGIGFAIPINTVKEITGDLKKFGKVISGG